MEIETIKITESHIDEFIKLYKAEFGEDIPRDKACDQLRRLVYLVSLLIPTRENLVDLHVRTYMQDYKEEFAELLNITTAKQHVGFMLDCFFVSIKSDEGKDLLLKGLVEGDSIFKELEKYFFSTIREKND